MLPAADLLSVVRMSPEPPSAGDSAVNSAVFNFAVNGLPELAAAPTPSSVRLFSAWMAEPTSAQAPPANISSAPSAST